MKVKRDPKSTTISFVIHGLVILLIAYMLMKKVAFTAPAKTTLVTEIAIPPKAPPRAEAMGGGGGQRGPTPVTKGTPPKFAEQQIVPPKAPPLVEPKIKIEPTVEVQKDVKMASSLPQIGVANSPLVGMSMGNGRGTGLGSGNGSGIGAGSGGNTGGGPGRIGGGGSGAQTAVCVGPLVCRAPRRAKLAWILYCDRVVCQY